MKILVWLAIAGTLLALLIMATITAILPLAQLILLYILLPFILIMGAVTLIQNFRRYRLQSADVAPETTLPTVSICIPARNENHALTDCLHAALSSDYEKLEIIVYDDCSQDKTSELIRSFAHSGVRFIKGATPSEHWLGKNLACSALANEASGKYLLFIGVDTRLSPATVSALVQYQLGQSSSMISVLPTRNDGLRTSIIFSTLRFFWTLLLPLKWGGAVSSSLWMIRADTLKELGGFESVSSQIIPEQKFAQAVATNRSYRFIISTPAIGVTNAKKWSSQVDTAIRLYYPLLHRSPFAVILTAYLSLSSIIAFVIAIVGVAGPDSASHSAAIVAVVLLAAFMILYGYYASRVLGDGWIIAALLLPLIVIQELALLLCSMFMYWLGRVIWKGRNVCYPIVRQ